MNATRHRVPWHTRDVAVATRKRATAGDFYRLVVIAPRGIALAHRGNMHALEFEGELLACDRPTIPVPPPRESGIRLKVARVAYSAATVDVVVCDLSRDPRSEDCLREAPKTVHRSGFFPARCTAAAVAQNERPPSTSIVRALK